MLNKMEVTRFLVEGARVKGVEVNGEEILEADHFISNIHPQRTVALLDHHGPIRKAYGDRISAQANSYGIFTLHLFMKKNAFPYMNRNCFMHDSGDVWYNAETSRGKISTCMISVQASSESDPYADVVTILTPMYMDEVRQWEHTVPGQRGDDYVSFKESKTRQLLDFMKKHGVDYGDSIDSMSSTTPLSYRDYTGTVNGSAYGIVKDFKYPQKGFVSVRTKLENLLLTGQNLNVHGALGVTLTSMITCSELLGEEYLAKKAGNA